MKTTSRWRPVATRIIEKVIAENPNDSETELRAKIRDAYPWGERARHPYKIWCEEVNRLLITKGKAEPKRPEDEYDLFNQPK